MTPDEWKTIRPHSDPLAVAYFDQLFELLALAHMFDSELSEQWIDVWQRKAGDQRARRSLLHSFFALVAGTSHQLRMVAIARHAIAPPDCLSVAEICLLRDEQFSLADNGKAKTKTRYQPGLKANLLFSVRAFAKVSDLEFQLDIGGIGWEAMSRSIDVRDRITHPKLITDLARIFHLPP